ncbi:hypothetical protein conserved [Leishmania donovani]|uniref:Uncharacterized protein n=3 Tax=Leishmania donovani species complex TaxID=38574 RepID=A4IDX4_LEIIN|nr:conserved hypothetical protein [Leishmania infantum JPCM5]TPP49594.1 hypothetical protein CGC20_19355 [Leishmania donovani]CAC9552618.1 hypothetical_protein_-_conserved [Leishmania infantum]CAJ1993959.1 hypothetical protein conserved [Leishmania donovani]CAM73060.1 conserved hypothetical protein [Leishmania infantum JPCM5]SUZ46966.1 hypothetical_protein_-_conserved [Leishmania infantum]|eukprot:XP_001469943.1 conserved hypothetical protein [Leishmania infantum JPCM5]
MLARTPYRLWTPRYFRGQASAGRYLGKRRVRALDAAPPHCLTGAAKGGETVTVCALPTRAPPPPKPARKSPAEDAPSSPSVGQNLNQPRISGLHSPPPDILHTSNPLVQRAQELLHELTTVGYSQSSLSPAAAKGFAEFSARRDVLGPLRGLLPPPAKTSGGDSANPASRQRFRVVPVVSGSPVVPPRGPRMTAAADFALSDLVLFLRLYDSANVEDGQLLVQVMNEIRRQLFALAETAADAAAARDGSSTPSVAGTTVGDHDLEAANKGVKGISRAPSASPLPLPAMLYTMSSLGIVEEAVLDVVTSCAVHDGARGRRGLLYSQLRLYSVADLLQLLVALHRFGHQQQPSTMAVTKALRASLYSTSTTTSRFHRRARSLKKAFAARSRTPASGEGRVDATAADADTGGVAAMIAADEELSSLALGLECPLFLLLEALTATATTVHRRADVVAFLSDLIAVTAVAELTTAVHESRGRHSPAGCEDLAREAQEFVFAVSHQLLRAAKLTECMELPQILLSDVFAWSTTLSGRGVFVDGGEDNAVPSDRVAYYDHVTADLIKANSAD